MYKHLILMVSLLALAARLTEQQPVKASQDAEMDHPQENLPDDLGFSANQMLSLKNALGHQQQLVSSKVRMNCNHDCRLTNAFANARDPDRKSVRVNVSNPLLLAQILLSLVSEMAWGFVEEADPDMDRLTRQTWGALVDEQFVNNIFYGKEP